jgi:hypothetical protein
MKDVASVEREARYEPEIEMTAPIKAVLSYIIGILSYTLGPIFSAANIPNGTNIVESMRITGSTM